MARARFRPAQRRGLNGADMSKATTSDWQAAAAKEVKGRDLTWHTPEGFAIQPLYTRS